VLIVDAQVHIWTEGKASAHHSLGRPEPFTAAEMLAEMDAGGVDGALLAPPTWDPGGNQPSLDAARAAPDRFAVTGNIEWMAPENPDLIHRWRDEPGMYGLRLIFNSPEKQAHLASGAADWIWREAERVDLPVMLLAPGAVSEVEKIAARYSGLRLCLDHLGIPRGAKNAAAFEHMPQLLALAKYANVSVKAGGLPTYSTIDSFPYPSLHAPLREAFDAFGPERIFWASDLTRMACTYSEVVDLVAEGLPWLSAEDRRQIMGESVCRWLGWTPRHAPQERP
jgi:L-fuconolactonase